MPESWRKVSSASAYFTGSQLLQSGIGFPASGSFRYRWSQISPALPSYGINARPFIGTSQDIFSRKKCVLAAGFAVIKSRNVLASWMAGIKKSYWYSCS
jgi:hypothetical protein